MNQRDDFRRWLSLNLLASTGSANPMPMLKRALAKDGGPEAMRMLSTAEHTDQWVEGALDYLMPRLSHAGMIA